MSLVPLFLALRTGGTAVSCMDGTNPSECSGYDTNCSTGFIGYVVCDGVRTDCNGETRTVPTGQCCLKDPCGGVSLLTPGHETARSMGAFAARYAP